MKIKRLMEWKRNKRRETKRRVPTAQPSKVKNKYHVFVNVLAFSGLEGVGGSLSSVMAATI